MPTWVHLEYNNNVRPNHKVGPSHNQTNYIQPTSERLLFKSWHFYLLWEKKIICFTCIRRSRLFRLHLGRGSRSIHCGTTLKTAQDTRTTDRREEHLIRLNSELSTSTLYFTGAGWGSSKGGMSGQVLCGMTSLGSDAATVLLLPASTANSAAANRPFSWSEGLKLRKSLYIIITLFS